MTTEDRLNSLQLIERNKDVYKLIALNVSVPFYSVGFIATVCDALASAGMNVLVVSTFSRDYIMVRVDLIERSRGDPAFTGFRRIVDE
ncbi:MAG: ACT domain-containing protein [Candidatus Obscuribacterales bacterium]